MSSFLSNRVLQMLGATGVGYYGREYVPLEWLEKQLSMLGGAGSGLAGSGGDARELAKVLQQLGHKLDAFGARATNATTLSPMAAPGTTPPPTVIVQHSSSSSSSLRSVSALAVAAGLTYCYLKYWRGVRFEDFKLATQGSVKDAVAGFGASLEAMRILVTDAKTALGQRIEQLKTTIRKIRDDVGNVHDDVRDVKSDMDATRSLAESCDRRLQETSAKQDYANRGIQALCAVVGELLHNAARTPAIENLRSFSRLGRPAAGSLPASSGGTERLLDDDDLALRSSSSLAANGDTNSNGNAASEAKGDGGLSTSDSALSESDLEQRVRAVQAIAQHLPQPAPPPRAVD